MNGRRTTQDKVRDYAANRHNDGFVEEEDSNLFAGDSEPVREIVVYKDRENPYTDTGLKVNESWTENDWRGMAPEIKVIGTAYQFIVGDYTLHGLERGFVKDYEEVAELTGLKAETIEVFASISRAFPRLIRVNSLEFGHYRKIAARPDDHKEDWIRLTVENNWSVRDLAKAIKAHYLPSPAGNSTAPVTDKDVRSGVLKIAHLRKKPRETWSKKEKRDFFGAMGMLKQFVADQEKWIEQGGGDDG